MQPVVIYTKPFCPYCSRAEALLQRKGVKYEEVVASMDPEKRQEMMQRSGRSTYPQIFIGDRHIGGCDDLHDLEARGELDKLLNAA
ncbi:MAG TPA: glutaredoxin 3 [Caulobacteraceae bacterium]|nr:glutaredoxin 3 [Caulobacteraceae bacterium]